MSDLTVAEITKKETWNEFVTQNSTGHVTQTWQFGEVRKQMGTDTVRIGVTENGILKAAAQFTIHPLPYLPLKIGYIPRGPVCSADMDRYLPPLFEFLKAFGKKNKIAYYKAEPNIIKARQSSPWQETLIQNGFHKSINTRFMPATSVIDLTPNKEDLLMNCRKKYPLLHSKI